MASLLSKFRIDYSDLILLPDITKKPEESTVAFFDDLIKNFLSNSEENDESEYTKEKFFPLNYSWSSIFIAMITKSELLAVQDKTNRHLRLREYLLEHSANSDLVCEFFYD